MIGLKRFFVRASGMGAAAAIVLASFGSAALPQAAQAAGCSSGSLIKSASAAAVYYCGNDGLRYVFPNLQTYKTWYSGFSGVQTLSDLAVSAIPLGGNITYKPGVRLVKVQSMPKVYAVAQGGVLRWVSTETAATALYGSNWNQQVDDLPDWAWVDYGVGQSIVSASDFSPSSASANATIPANTFTHSSSSSSSSSYSSTPASVSVSLSPYSSSLSAGQMTTATVTAYDPAGISAVRVYVNGSVAQSCSGGGATGVSCSANIYASNYSGSSSLSVYGQETNSNGGTTSSSTSSLSVSSSAGSVSLSLSPYSSSLPQGQSTTVSAYASDSAGLANVYIYANGSVIQTCGSLNGVSSVTCTATLYGASYAVGSTVSLYATEISRNGASTSSSTSSLAVASASGSSSSSSGSVSLSLSPYSSSLPQGQSTTVSAYASDSAGLANVYIYANGSVIQTCSISAGISSAYCSATVYASSYTAGSSVAVYAQANNRNGQVSVSSTSSLSIGSASSSGTGSVSLSFSPYSSSLPQGSSTAVVAQASDTNGGLSAIYIYLNGSVIKTCANLNGVSGATCSATVYGSSYSSGAALSIYATETGVNGGTASSSTSSLTVSSSSAASGSGSVTVALSPYSSSLPRGQSTSATVLVTDSAGISTINVYANGAIVQSCSGLGGVNAASCTATLYGVNYANGATISIYGQETNNAGYSSTSSTSTLTVN